MLIYHPAFDAYHCVFRLLCILDRLTSTEQARIRILDYLLVFPGSVSEFSLPRAAARIKSSAKRQANVYRGPVNTKQAFRDMEHIQLAAIRTLTAAGLIDSVAIKSGRVTRTDMPLPLELTEAIRSSLTQDNDVIRYIFEDLADLPLTGENGLKHRSGLMEYRYDTA